MPLVVRISHKDEALMMIEDPDGENGRQHDLFEMDKARSMLDQLLAESRLYTQTKDYKDLLDFVVRLRNFAPFNALLLQVQKPGLSYAASALDWRERFGRTPVEGARPLLILWPFGPVALVYDVLDTEGDPLPQDVAAFFAHGTVDQSRFASFLGRMAKKGIDCRLIDSGDEAAGRIGVLKRPADDKQATLYRVCVNRNHALPVQFVTLAHELAHLFLGHLGPDKALNVPSRPSMNHAQRELEAESAAYVVCERNGVSSRSQPYLSHFVARNSGADDLDLYQIMRAAGQVETLLGLTANTKFEPRGKGRH